MPHVSKKKLPVNIEKLLEEALVKVFSNLQSNSVKKVFSTLITETETKMLMKRLAILFLLNQGLDLENIAKETRTTRQTVARIRLQLLEIPDESKSFVIKELNKWKNIETFKSLLKGLSELPISRSEFRKKITPF